jgi:hypothetical protein
VQTIAGEEEGYLLVCGPLGHQTCGKRLQRRRPTVQGSRRQQRQRMRALGLAQNPSLLTQSA